MDKSFILKVEIPGTNAGAKVNYNEICEVFTIETSTGYTCISRKAIEDAGQSLEDWFEVESDESISLSQALQFGEHIKELCKSEQTVKPYYELQKFLKTL